VELRVDRASAIGASVVKECLKRLALHLGMVKGRKAR
jgi:hypothetical protein